MHTFQTYHRSWKSQPPLFLPVWVLSILMGFGILISEVDGDEYWGFCKDTCEKHGSGAYTLDCNTNGKNDPECGRNCFFCPTNVCDNSQSHKVYHCPGSSGSGFGDSGNPFAGGVIMIIVCIAVLLLCCCGIAGCVYCAARSRRNNQIGGGAPMMYGGGGMGGQTVYPSTMYYQTASGPVQMMQPPNPGSVQTMQSPSPSPSPAPVQTMQSSARPPTTPATV